MYSLCISSFPKILFQNESIETSVDTTVPKKEIPPYVPVKIPPEVQAAEAAEKNTAKTSLEQLAFTYPDYSTKNISENNAKNLYTVASYLAKIPDSPKKQAILQRLTDIQKVHESIKSGNQVGLTSAETLQIQTLIYDINQELVAEKQVIVRETGIELGNQTQKVQEAESEFVTKNKEYQIIRTNLEKKLILWSKAEAGSDLQKLALSITPLLDENDYESIEKVLIQYKARQNQMNQIPESEKQEKESKILVQMKDFYENSIVKETFFLDTKDTKSINFTDFRDNPEFMEAFRKDALGKDFLVYEIGGKITNTGGEIDELILAIKNAEFSAEDAKDSAQNLMTANSEKMSALTEYNTAIKEYETVIVQTQTFEKQFTQQKIAQTYPNYKTLTASDIPGTNQNTYDLAFAVNQNIRVTSSISAVRLSENMPPNSSMMIPSSTGEYNYMVSKTEKGNLSFGIPRMGVQYDVSNPSQDIPFYSMMAETPMAQYVFLLGPEKFGLCRDILERKIRTDGIQADLSNPNIFLNMLMKYMGKMVGALSDTMPSRFDDGKTSDRGIKTYFAQEGRIKEWNMSLVGKGILGEDRRLRWTAFSEALRSV